MALVNPNIAMSYKPTTEYQPENALANYAKIQQVQSGQLELQEYKRKTDVLSKIQSAIVSNGGPPDLRAAATEMMKNPEYLVQGRQLLQELDDTARLEDYLKRRSGGKPSAAPTTGTAATPNALVAPGASAAPAMPGQLGSGTFDIMPAFSNARYLTSGDTTNRALSDKIVQMGQSAPRDLRQRGFDTPESESQRRLMERIGQSALGAPSTPVAPAAPAAPAAPSAGTPRGYATPTNALAPTPAPATNALAPTAAPVAPMDEVAQLEEDILFLSQNRDPRSIALVNSLEKRLQKLQPQVVGNNIYDPVTKTFIQGPSQRLVPVIGADGLPTLVTADQAVGMTPLTPATARKVGIGVTGRAVSSGEKPQGKPIKLSAGLEKELIKQDDAVQSSQNVIDTLNQALAINEKTYSGYGATGRAMIRSNLPGESPEADATIAFDNIIRNQALQNLKATFGAAPTEGERKVLLEIQASADKTPAQRKEIIERAILLAQNRKLSAEQKAQNIRSGEYLTKAPNVPSGSPRAPVNIDALLDKYK